MEMGAVYDSVYHNAGVGGGVYSLSDWNVVLNFYA